MRCREAHITFVGFNWHQHDEAKLLHSHEWGHRNFGRFVDLRQLANQLRLPHGGLACLAQHVLGVVLPQQKRVSKQGDKMHQFQDCHWKACTDTPTTCT